MELHALVEDPQNASVRILAAEAFAMGSTEAAGMVASADPGSVWVSPAPVRVKMRLFCLPYAGGVSENVYGR